MSFRSRTTAAARPRGARRLDLTDSLQWLADFREATHRRSQIAEPDWAGGTDLTPAVVLSLQRFQVGESGDGAHLIANADLSGDTDYAAAVRLFVAEEQNHARMLAALLRAGGHDTVDQHWSDTVFVHLRRLLGLRLEVMILAIAEVIALRYYRALAEGEDRLLTDVAERILDDEHRHVPFQIDCLRERFGHHPAAVRHVLVYLWRAAALVVTVVVGLDHGPALRDLAVSRRRFIIDTWRLFVVVSDAVLDSAPPAGSVRRPTSRRPIS